MAGRHRKPPHRPAPGRHRKARQPGRWATPALVGVIALGLGGVAAAAAITSGGGSAPRAPLSLHAATPASTMPTTARSTQPAAAPKNSAVRRSVSTRHVGFALTVTGRVSWVEVGVPGRRPVFQGLLRHGRTVRSQARPLRVVVGDAGAVRLVLHGRVHAPLGRPGQVLVFTVAR